MNDFAVKIVTGFRAQSNRDNLAERLRKRHIEQLDRVNAWLKESLDDMIENYAQRIAREMNFSDPMPGYKVTDYIEGYNEEFLATADDLLRDYILDQLPPEYTVHDGLPTSRRGLGTYRAPPKYILGGWYNNAAPGVASRDDTAGEVHSELPHPYHGRGDNHMRTGITFCDQSETNQYSHHAQLLNRSYVRDLNRVHGGSANTCQGNYVECMYGGQSRGDYSKYGANSILSANGPTLSTDYIPRVMVTHTDMHHDPSQCADMSSLRDECKHECGVNAHTLGSSHPRNDMHTTVPFGVATPASDARLLSRRTFRANEEGLENAVPRYEQRLQRRALDRDITESLRDGHASERGCNVYKHDMETLYCRTTTKGNIRRHYDRVPLTMDLCSNDAPAPVKYF